MFAYSNTDRNDYIRHFENNRPVADFYCPHCNEEYELKSQNGPVGNKVNDGAYATMLARLEAIRNPNFFFMHYDKNDMQLKDKDGKILMELTYVNVK